MCPFKDKKKISLWPVILIIMNLPEAMRYDPRNIIIIYIAASAAGGQPKNFHTHLSMVVDELIGLAMTCSWGAWKHASTSWFPCYLLTAEVRSCCVQ